MPYAHAQLTINVPAGGDVVGAANQVLAAGGGTINLAAGTYNIQSSIVMGSNTTISGAGPSTIIQLPSSPNGIAAFTSNGGSNMTIENLVMDGGVPRGAFLVCCGGNGNPYSNTGVYMFSYNSAEVNVTLSNLEIRNFGMAILMGTVNGLTLNYVNVHDNNPGNFAHNIYLVSCDNVTFNHSRSSFAHAGDGLHIDFGGVNTTLHKSEFSNNDGFGVLSQENVNVNFSDSASDFNTNDGFQSNASGLFILRDRGSFNGAYGFDVPSTADGNGTINGYYGMGNGADIGYLYQASLANLSTGSAPNVYEAEMQDGVVGVTDTADWTTAYPGFSGPGAVDFNANHLTNGLLSFNRVGVAANGNYQVTFRYSNGTSGALSMALTVNGAAQLPLSFPSTGSNSTWNTVNVTVPLVMGNNVIAIAPSGSAAPEIDNLTVQTSVPSAPSAPTNLTATAIDPYTVKLTWTAPPTASYYIIQQNGITIASNVVGNTYTDTRIHFGKSTLSYAVIAVNQGGGTASTVSVTTPIDSPAGFQGPNTGPGAGNYFNWMSSNGASYYNLKRSTVSGGPYQTAVQVPNTTSLTSSNFEQTGEDTTAVPGTTYYYVVTAVDANGTESATSTYQIAATTPYPGFTLSPSPSSVSTAWGQSASATITLQPLSGFTGAVNYTIQGLPSGTTAAFGTASGNVTPLTFTTANGATTGTFNLTITGTQGSITASTTIQLTVASQVITFNPIPQQSVGNSLTLTASASSGLPVAFSAVPNGNCSVSGNVATFLNTGDCGIVASQAGGNGYGAAASVGQVIVVGNPVAQTITFATIASQPAGGTLALTATASSGLTVSYSSSTASVCTVSGSTASLIAAGTCTLTASQSGGGVYGPATPVSQSFTVTAAQQSQTITFNAIPAQTVGTTLTVSATASSGLPVTFSVVPNGNCSVSGNVVTFLNVGNCGVLANQAGNSSYTAAPQVGQIVVVNNPTPQTITFGTIAAQKVGTPLTLSATASSGLAVTFASSTTSVCTVSGSTASFAAAGTCTITASQAGNGTYAAATPVSQSFTVNAAQQSQTITFNAIPAQTVGTTLTVSATASSGLAVTFASSTTSVCTVSGSTASFAAAGTCTITASQAGNGTYAAATPVSQSFTVNAAQQSQTITFNAIPAQTVGTTLTVSATASSGLPVTFSVVPNGNCSVSGNVVTFLNVGNCGVLANQAGNGSYTAAPQVGQIVVVNNPTPQTITFGTIAAQKVGTPLTVSATASSGLAVTFASSTTSVCTVSGSTASFAAAGTCTITASQAGNGTYSAATPVSQSFTVNAAQQSQTITFNAIPAQTVGTTLTVSATASSGLPVTFSVVPNGNCSVSGNVVTFLNVGNCGVLANQAGNSSYTAAPQVGQIVVVNNPTPQTITFGTIAAQKVGTPLTLSATASSGLAVTFASSTTSVCTVSGSTASFAAAGTCTITASQAGNGTYAAATPVSQSFTVTAAQQSQTITFGALPSETVGSKISVNATASSGLPVTYSVVQNGNCSVSGNVVTMLAAGNCGVLANQAGNSSYAAAPQVGQIVVVGNAAFKISAASSTLTLPPGNGTSMAITVTPVGSFKGTLSYSVSGGPTGASYAFTQTSASGTTFVIYLQPSTAAGTYNLTITGASGSTNASTTIALTVS